MQLAARGLNCITGCQFDSLAHTGGSEIAMRQAIDIVERRLKHPVSVAIHYIVRNKFQQSFGLSLRVMIIPIVSGQHCYGTAHKPGHILGRHSERCETFDYTADMADTEFTVSATPCAAYFFGNQLGLGLQKLVGIRIDEELEVLLGFFRRITSTSSSLVKVINSFLS